MMSCLTIIDSLLSVLYNRQHTSLPRDKKLSKDVLTLYCRDLKADRQSEKVLLQILRTLFSFEIKLSLAENYETDRV